jgi:glycerate 2-kinase
VAILSGGELTVTLAAAAAAAPTRNTRWRSPIHLDGAPGIAALAADTDGTDGGGGRPDDPAGAFIDEPPWRGPAAAGLDPAAFLADNDSTGFFNGIGDLFRNPARRSPTSPTSAPSLVDRPF